MAGAGVEADTEMSAHDFPWDSHETTAPHHTPGAESWTRICGGVSIYITNDVNIYINPETFRRKGDVMKWWELWDYKTAQTVVGETFLSIKAQREFDCAEELHRVLSQTWFSANMGKGNLGYSNSDEEKWRPVQPDGIGRGIWEIVCDKRRSHYRAWRDY